MASRKRITGKKTGPPETAGATILDTKSTWITPAMASAWLARNTANRKINKNRVAKYAGAMKRNEWRLTGDAIRFSDAGSLLDGQHRLHACVAADVPFESVVITGLDSDIMLTIDTGMPRTRGSVLTILGERNGRELASACTWLWRIRAGRGLILKRAASPTNDEILKILEEKPEVRERLTELKKTKYTVGVLRNSGLMAAFYTYIYEKHPVGSKAFFEVLLTGIDASEGDPALATRNRIIRYRAVGKRITPEDLLTWLTYGWNAYLRGAKLSRLQCSKKLPRFDGGPNWDAMEEAEE